MATVLPTILIFYPFRLQSTPNLSNSLLTPDGMYIYFITCAPILILSPTAILDLPINLLCPLDTALVLPSDSFHSISPPSLPLLLSSHSFPWWLLLETVMWLHLYSVFTYIYSLLIEKDHMRVKMYQLNFHVLIWFTFAPNPDIFSFFV